MTLESDIKKEIKNILNNKTIFNAVALQVKNIIDNKNYINTNGQKKYFLTSNQISTLIIMQKLGLAEQKASETMIPTENGTVETYFLTEKAEKLYKELEKKKYYNKPKNK